MVTVEYITNGGSACTSFIFTHVEPIESTVYADIGEKITFRVDCLSMSGARLTNAVVRFYKGKLGKYELVPFKVVSGSRPYTADWVADYIPTEADFGDEGYFVIKAVFDPYYQSGTLKNYCYSELHLYVYRKESVRVHGSRIVISKSPPAELKTEVFAVSGYVIDTVDNDRATGFAECIIQTVEKLIIKRYTQELIDGTFSFLVPVSDIPKELSEFETYVRFSGEGFTSCISDIFTTRIGTIQSNFETIEDVRTDEWERYYGEAYEYRIVWSVVEPFTWFDDTKQKVIDEIHSSGATLMGYTLRRAKITNILGMHVMSIYDLTIRVHGSPFYPQLLLVAILVIITAIAVSIMANSLTTLIHGYPPVSPPNPPPENTCTEDNEGETIKYTCADGTEIDRWKCIGGTWVEIARCPEEGDGNGGTGGIVGIGIILIIALAILFMGRTE